MINLTHSELFVGGVYFPPALLVGLAGFFVAIGVVKLLNRTHLSRFFWNPPLAFLGIWVLICSVIGLGWLTS